MIQLETVMLTDAQRIKEVLKHLRLTKNGLGVSLGDKNGMRLTHVETGRNKISAQLASDITSKYPNISYDWLLNGEGEMFIKKEDNAVVNEPYEIYVTANKNGSDFLKLENGQYLMTMPLAEWSVQAGLLDHYQDIEYVKDMAKHSIIVDEPYKGRYMAFRVKGDSMDNGTSEGFVQNMIVSTRELQRQHWTSKLRYKDFPYWIIYTTQNKMPLLKEIIDHDVETGVITCHSLNDSPEYNDFELHINDVQALFYVIHKSMEVSKKAYY